MEVSTPGPDQSQILHSRRLVLFEVLPSSWHSSFYLARRVPFALIHNSQFSLHDTILVSTTAAQCSCNCKTQPNIIFCAAQKVLLPEYYVNPITVLFVAYHNIISFTAVILFSHFASLLFSFTVICLFNTELPSEPTAKPQMHISCFHKKPTDQTIT